MKFKNIVFLVICLSQLLMSKAIANGHFSMPGSPQMPYGQYRFQSGDFSCETPAASGGTYLDYGVYGKQASASSANGGNPNAPISPRYGGDFQANDVGVYARMVVPLDKIRGIDCTKYYELELERKRLELEIMKNEINERSSAASGGMEFKKNP